MRLESHVKIWSHIPLPRPIVKAFKHSNMSGESVWPFVSRDDSQVMPRLKRAGKREREREIRQIKRNINSMYAFYKYLQIGSQILFCVILSNLLFSQSVFFKQLPLS